MSPPTDGDRRGLIARWVMRLEAAGPILRMGFQGTTAASTLTAALALIGWQDYAPIALAIGIGITFGFAFLYVESGVFNRKNRERADRGENYAGPTMRIDDALIGRAVFAAHHGRPPSEEEAQAIDEAVDGGFNKYRNGVEVEP